MTYISRIVAILVLTGIVYACDNVGERNNNIEGKATQVVMCVPATNDREWYNENKQAPLFEGLDGIKFKITTGSEIARTYFLQGLMLAYGFNHAEAARSFFQVTREDPQCAMGYWGYAYVLGPNYNSPMDPEDVPMAYKACRKADELAKGLNKKEKALIRALQARYAKEAPEDPSELNRAYADAMKQVYEQFPLDPDIGTLYAESLMNLHPWDLWLKNGDYQPWTAEIVRVLERVLEDYPNHAGANHFYIHAVEASPFPELGLRSASVLETLVPGASHLVHMPSHIYINTGDYHLGSMANLRAVEVDSNYVETCHAYGVFPILYYGHNWHFLSATATLEGSSQLAMKAAYKVADLMDLQLMKEPGWETMQHYYLIPYHIAVKFGLWEEVLQMSNADTTLPYPEAVRHYARGLAFLARGDRQYAVSELAMLEILKDNADIKKMTLWEVNPVSTLVDISYNILKAEIMAKDGKFEEGIDLLREAVMLEDSLIYAEPPDWFFSVRHSLGAILLEAGRYEEAEEIYLEDLVNYPKNGWAYLGLYKALTGQGKKEEAEKNHQLFNDSWQWSDTELSSSRIL